MSSKSLDSLAQKTYINVENKKIPLKCNLDIHLNKPIKMTVTTINSENSFYNNINFEITSNILPEQALKNPITKERIKSQIEKTTNTPYKFIDISIDMDNNLYIPHIADINNLRRTCLDTLENFIIDKYCNKHINITYPNMNICNTIANNIFPNSISPRISILLNKLNLNYNYSSLENIDNVYIPLKYFTNTKYFKILELISKKFNLYVYIPTIMRNYYIDLLTKNLKKILTTFNITGFVISNIGNTNLIQKLITETKINKSYTLIGNYTLNIYNNLTITELFKMHFSNLNLDTITVSPELNEEDFNNLQKNFNPELIVYGKIPIMNINYCPLSQNNKCLTTCPKYCLHTSKYYLVDRLGFNFEIIPDFGDCITTVYNSKILSIEPPKSLYSARLDFIYENISEINSIINIVKSENRLEGSNFTNGNWHREV